MNRSDSQATPARVDSAGKKSGAINLLPLVAAVAYLPLKYGLALGTTDFGLAAGSMGLAYLLAIYLIVALTRTFADGRTWLALTAAGVGLILGGLMGHADNTIVMVGEWGAIVGVSYFLARWAGRISRFRLYLYGLLIVIAGSMIIVLTQASDMMAMAADLTQGTREQFETYMKAAGYSSEMMDEVIGGVDRILAAVVRLLPLSIIMNLVLQFSVGFIWLGRTGEIGGGQPLVAPLTRWRMPFGFIPVVIVLVLARLVGPEPLKLVADNAIAGLSLFYCATGLSLIQFFLIQIKLPVAVRILFYLMIIVTGFLGYFLAVALGFFDSFGDWRKLSAPANSLKKKNV